MNLLLRSFAEKAHVLCVRARFGGVKFKDENWAQGALPEGPMRLACLCADSFLSSFLSASISPPFLTAAPFAPSSSSSPAVLCVF